MPWTRKFAEPITLKDGRTLVTLIVSPGVV
jgi:hypothetical protein